MNTTPSDAQQQQIRAALEDAVDVVCDECENAHFIFAFTVKKISALISPNGQETIVPIQVLKCDKCGHVNEGFLKSNNS